MKNIKNIWLGKAALVAAMVFTATACQQDEIIEMAKPMPQGEYISFNIQRGWNYDDISRSADNEYGSHLSNHVLVSEDKSESIEMSAYQQPIDSWFEKPSSRGTMITSASFNEFMAFGYKTKDGVTAEIFKSSYHSLANEGDDDAGWEKPVDTTEGSENANGYQWPGAEYTCSFFGIAMSDGKLTTQDFYSNVTTTTNDAGQIVSFDYTVPEAAIDQPDIMVAATGNVKGDGLDGATLNFKHILSAINVKVGTATANEGETIEDLTINSITFNNVYGKGQYSIATNAWSNTVFYDKKSSYSVDFNSNNLDGSYSNFEDHTGAIMNKDNATMMLIPQTLRNDATITVVYTLKGVETTSTANIGGTIWEAGKAYNYVLNINNTDGVEFLTQDSYVDAHYIILPLNIKCQNRTATLRAVDANGTAVDWVQFRSSLVEVENDGWWAHPDSIYDEEGNKITDHQYSRSNTLTITKAGQYFAFLTENTGTEKREVTLQLLSDNVVKDETTIIQLCPTWNSAGTKGCERIEEGESLPWGYSWEIKEGQEEEGYKTVVRVSDLSSRFWAAIVNLLFSGGAKYEFKWIYDDYTFDYTSFIEQMTNEQNGAGSTGNGLQNSIYMFNYEAAGNMLGFYDFLVNSLGGEPISQTFEGVPYDEYATKEALKKNKVRVLIGTSSGEEMHNAVITKGRTDLWYLPATGEVGLLQNNTDMIEGVETMMNNGDIFWTSTAAATPNAYSYIWGNPGSTPTADRDNAYRIRAIRDITSTSSTTE